MKEATDHPVYRGDFMDNLPPACGCVFHPATIDPCHAPTFSRKKTRKARKKHSCLECGRDILPGESYLYESGKWESGFKEFKTCADCQSMRDTFYCGLHYFGMIWDDLRAHIKDMDCHVSGDCILALTHAARNRVFEIIEACWQSRPDE